jgi:hypothetical protein
VTGVVTAVLTLEVVSSFADLEPSPSVDGEIRRGDG